MNAGLSNLATLKAWLLPAAMLEATDYDAQILAIGLGTAAQLEEFCNRKFARTVGDTFEASADRAHVVLPRFPVEVLTAVEQRDTSEDAWQDIASRILTKDLPKGFIEFGADQGVYYSRLKFTFTGGFFWNQLEPDEDNYPTELPAGATAVPANLQLAWRLQCEWIWTKRDKLGLTIAEKTDNVFGGSLAKVVLLDGVKELLRPFVRYSLT